MAQVYPVATERAPSIMLRAAVATEHSSRQIGYPLLTLTIMAAPAYKRRRAKNAPFQRLGSKKRLSAREEDARRSRDRESCEIEGHTFFCRCKKFPGTRTKFPRHTHTHLARPLTIPHATNRSDQQARPAPAPHKTPSTARQSVVFAFQPAFRESIWVL